MYPTLLRKSELPDALHVVNPDYVKDGVKQLCERIATLDKGVIVLCGLKRGKSTNAAALLLSFLHSRRGIIDTEDVGYYVSVHNMCYLNRTVDKYNRDPELMSKIRKASNAKCLVLDGVFSYLTQNDDLLLQAIYDNRQNSNKITIVTTSVEDPMECAGSILYRITRDAIHKEVF